jgi:predicted AlkP superfamily pyrophosphatase or phosphodiesterase
MGSLEESVRRLVAPAGPSGLPVPAYGGRSLPNVTRSVVDALGVELGSGPEVSPPLEQEVDPFRGGRAEGTVVVLLVDGFGWKAFDTWTSAATGTYAPVWRRLAQPITTVFPTTTTAALTSLSTAAPPGRTGVVGYRQFLPAFGTVADILHMAPVGVSHAESLVGPHWTPSIVSGVPSIFRRGAPGVAVSRDRFQGTGFTRILYDGAEYVPYVTASDLAHQLARVLGRSPAPPLVFAYWDELDTVHHARGPRDDMFGLEADRLGQLIDHVARAIDPGRARSTTLLVTADHGQKPTEPSAQIRVDLEPAIAREMSRPLAGDRRAAYLAARPGRSAALRSALESRVPPGSQIVDTDDALAAGLFGPPPFHPELRDRIGDLIVFVPEPAGLIQVPPGAAPSSREVHGSHGGLTPEELLIPLVAGRLSEFAGGEGSPRHDRR